MSERILLITPMEEAGNWAASLKETLSCTVAIASSYRAGLTALRRGDYSIVVVDDRLAEANPAGAELLWKHCGLAAPLQLNLSTSSGVRLARDLRAAIARRERERAFARRAAACLLETELKAAVAGLLLQSQLALAEPALPVGLSGRLKLVAELAGSLRQVLERAQTSAV